MALIRPYITDKFTSYKREETLTFLSIAIWLKDDYTKGKPVGNVKVMIKEGDKDIDSIKNPSGYYIFTNLESRDYKVRIEPEFYFHAERITDPSKIKTLDALNLNFDGNGPAAGATSAKLTDVSELQNNYVVEFRNPDGKVEERGITDVDKNSRTIYWDEALKYGFNAPDSTIHAVSYLIEFILKPKGSYPFPDKATLVRGVVTNTDPVVDAQVKVENQNIGSLTDESGEFVLYFEKVINKKIKIIISQNGNIKSIETTLGEGETKSLGIVVFP